MDVFDLYAKLSLDSSGYDRALNDARTSGDTFATKFAMGAKAVGKVIVDTVKQSVSSYAEYEQLVGGVDTLFKDSSEKVQQFAASAFKTAGLSANQYMETVTSFSASLLQSLGGDTEKAAIYADVAIRDMSDNANKMGTSMESIQYAYQGFAKGQYQLLDNLKLGYGGTKSEMERLVLDAEKLNTSFKASRNTNGELALSYADIVDAIHIVQNDMGITGTTATEASETIQGSVSALKASWDNLLTGFADENADLGKLIDNVLESAITAAGNLVPRIEQALKGLGESVGIVLQKAFAELPSFVEGLPEIANTGLAFVSTFIKNLEDSVPESMSSITDVVMSIVDAIINTITGLDVVTFANAAASLVSALADGITDSIGKITEKLPELITGIIDWLVNPSNLTGMMSAALDIFGAIVSDVPAIITSLATGLGAIVQGIVDYFTENDASLEEGFMGMFDTFGEKVSNIWNEQLLPAFEEMFTNIKNAFLEFEWVQTVGSWIGGLVSSVESEWNRVTSTVGQKIQEVKAKFEELKESALSWGSDLINNFIAGITAKWEELKQTVANVAQSVKNFLGFSEPKEGPLSNFHTYAPDMMNLFAKGIRENQGMLIDTITDAFDFGNAISTQSVEAAGALSSGYNGWSINVYGAQGMDEMTLARIVANRVRDEVVSIGAI